MLYIFLLTVLRILGVRALLVDKDKSPKWKPDHLEDVTEGMIDKCFEPLSQSEELDI